jgi:DNA uptake protein ComE-like DNA-binding protein
MALPPEPRATTPASTPPPSGAARLLWGLPLDLNREDARTFEALPGIGPTRARAIAAGRPYCRAADLARVPGIGPVTLRRLAGRVFASAPDARCGD